jgi:hypothetical protein
MKKPIVIEAVQFNALGDHPAVVVDTDSPTGYGINTLERTGSRAEVTVGDWIITGPFGETYACKDGIFRQTYEQVKETTP